MTGPIHRLSLLLLFAASASLCSAEVRLPKIFSDHAVLQRDRPIHIWGWADPGEPVSTSLHGETQTATADRLGHWNVYLAPQQAGGPYELTVSGSNRIVLSDILIGDVWFASGQSNMEMPLNGFPPTAVLKNGAAEIRNASQSSLRLLFIPHKASSYPLDDFQGEVGWTLCAPETAATFSAVAYFFGRDVAAREHVAVGLIDSTWGGTPAESWISMDGLSADAALMPVFATWAKMADQIADTPAQTRAEKQEDEAARENHAPMPKHSWHPDPDSWDPSWLYNGMIAPAINFGIKGVIWYQGESNSRRDRAYLYHRVFSTLIDDWRQHWAQGNVPFLFTQISSFKSDDTEDWPTVRDAQRRTLSLSNTAMAVTIDIGDPDNVHPPDKQTVGSRLSLAARALAYGENVEYSGPLFRQATTDAGAIQAWFDHVSGGLVSKGGPLKGFEVAGPDRRFVPGSARIQGATVVVTSPEVKIPKYVRYGWQNAPYANLFNADGLPASTFTSEPKF